MEIWNRRTSLNRFVLSYIFALSAYYITAGVAQTQFAKQMGMPASWFAVLAALPMIGSLMQLPASIISSKIGRRKITVILMGLFDRMLWVCIAAIPWIFSPGPWRWGGLLVMLTLLYLTVNIAAPLQSAWMADVVPPRVTGRLVGCSITASAREPNDS
jgi:MFS family permease